MMTCPATAAIQAAPESMAEGLHRRKPDEHS
jgi:hypothetical protein